MDGAETAGCAVAHMRMPVSQGSSKIEHRPQNGRPWPRTRKGVGGAAAAGCAGAA
jgi:hypothetical protein